MGRGELQRAAVSSLAAILPQGLASPLASSFGEFHTKTAARAGSPPKTSMLRHHPLRSGASSSICYHHLCSRERARLTPCGSALARGHSTGGAVGPYLYDGCQAG